jgi:hypothetical protein
MLKMNKVVNFVLICTLTVLSFCLVFVIMDIIDNKINKINKIYNEAQIVEPFITLGNDLRGYELRKDSKKYWIFTNEHSNPVIIDVTYKSEF